jgi:hypothetical protein
MEDNSLPLPSQEEVTKTIITARCANQKFEPFLARFLSDIPITISKGRDCYTDGKHIVVGYDFVKKYPRGAVVAVAHEMWHIALQHMPRFKSMLTNKGEHALMNVLTDMHINGVVEQSLNLSSREREIYHKDLVFKDTIKRSLAQLMKSGSKWEVVYDTNVDEPIHTQHALLKPFLLPSPPLMPSLVEGLGELGKNMSNADIQEIAGKIARSIQEAKARGTAPGSMSSTLEDLWIKQEVPWSKILSDKIQNRFKKKSSWGKFNRRSLW